LLPLQESLLHVTADFIEITLCIICKVQESLLYRELISNHVEAARVLLKNGADPNMRNEWGKSALDWAMSKQNKELAALLKNSGARE
jgi:hypothetical protein